MMTDALDIELARWDRADEERKERSSLADQAMRENGLEAIQAFNLLESLVADLRESYNQEIQDLRREIADLRAENIPF